MLKMSNYEQITFMFRFSELGKCMLIGIYVSLQKLKVRLTALTPPPVISYYCSCQRNTSVVDLIVLYMYFGVEFCAVCTLCFHILIKFRLLNGRL